MKFKAIFHLLLPLALCSCTKYNLIDSGVAQPNSSEKTMWEFFSADPYNWSMTMEVIERAGMKPLFDGSDNSLGQFTFLAPKNHSIRRYIYKMVENELRPHNDNYDEYPGGDDSLPGGDDIVEGTDTPADAPEELNPEEYAPSMDPENNVPESPAISDKELREILKTKGVKDIPVEVCKEAIQNAIIPNKILLRNDVPRGKRSTDPQQLIGTGGIKVQPMNAAHASIWVFSFQEPYNEVPDVGPVILRVATEKTQQIHAIVTSDLRTKNGVIQVLDHETFTFNDL